MTKFLPILLLTASVRASLFDFFPQKPLEAHHHSEKAQPESPYSPWTLNFTSPLPHLFASIPTMLHQWSNTMFPNGHALAAVELPAYTLLYHGLISPDERDPEPPSPEWVSFDAEMANGIMGSHRDAFLLTYQTTRPVKALYFDGESAALMGLATMDTQMLQLFGNVSGPGGRAGWGLDAEYLRAHGLCEWLEGAGLRGRGWGFEGVVRMNAGFEMIWCDFLSPSMRLVSRMNVTAPLLPDNGDQTVSADEAFVDGMDELATRRETNAVPEAKSIYPLPPQPTKTDRNAEPTHAAPPPNMRRDDREPFLRMQGWGWFDSATWHYGSNRNGPGQGEVRAKVSQCGILSYYSPQFVNQTRNRAASDQKSLNLTSDGLWMGPGKDGDRTQAIKQLARRRRYHHLGDVNTEEAKTMRTNSERVLRSLLTPENDCSGADWALITSEIISRVTDQLGMMDTKLASLKADTETYIWISELRGQSHLYLVPFLEYPREITRETWSVDTAYYRETQSRCRYRYTRLLVPEELGSGLTPEEDEIRHAIEEVYGIVCTVLITIHFGIELAWLDALADQTAASTLLPLSSTWHDKIAELTAWLGWENQYNGCKEQCAWDERCYIPMWPMLHWDRSGKGPGRRRPENGTHGEPGGGGGRGPPGNDGGHGAGGSDGTPPPPDHDGPGRDGPGRDRPGGKMPERDRSWMMESPDLWEPRCANITFIMGEP